MNELDEKIKKIREDAQNVEDEIRTEFNKQLVEHSHETKLKLTNVLSYHNKTLCGKCYGYGGFGSILCLTCVGKGYL